MRPLNNLSEISEIHKGKRAFIMGSGYSLNNFGFDKIMGDDIVFACNQAITAIKHCNYFCMTDGAIPEANFFKYGVDICDKIMFCGGQNFLDLPAVKEQYEGIKDKSCFFNRRYNDPDSVDFSLRDGLLIKGSDVIHVTAHLAYVMGCSPLILVGVDLNYSVGQKYCENSEFKEEVEWSLPHLRASMWPLSKNPSGEDDINLSKSYDTWQRIKEKNKDITFLNTNPYGRLVNTFNIF